MSKTWTVVGVDEDTHQRCTYVEEAPTWEEAEDRARQENPALLVAATFAGEVTSADTYEYAGSDE